MSKTALRKYLDKPEKVAVPARVNEATVERARATAKKMGVKLCDFVEAALNSACDDAVKVK